MSGIGPREVALDVRALHGYSLDEAGRARATEARAAVAAAVAVLCPEPQFHEEPANLAPTLAALAPDEG